MKVFLHLSLAVLLVTSALAGSVKEFVNDPQAKVLAPHLVNKISTQGIETLAEQRASTPAVTKVPLLNDLVEIASLVFFSNKDADWSRLEEAKLKAIRDHGAEAVDGSLNLTLVDTHRALAIVNTIYDTVIHLPAPSKETYTEAATHGEIKKSSLWDYVGFGLIKTSDAVRNVKSVVVPTGSCDTTDTAYLKGAEEVVYYSSLTDGLAGGTLAAAPSSSPVKSLGLLQIISSVGKLAIEIHMAQGVARLGNYNPELEQVKTMVLLALAAESTTDVSAQAAHDIGNMVANGVDQKIPLAALRSLQEQAALALITRGAGRGGGPAILANVPVLRNIFAFSSDVLTAHGVGDVIRYVFCPVPKARESRQATENDEDEVEIEQVKQDDTVQAQSNDQDDSASQKVLRVPEPAEKKVDEQVAEDAQKKTENGAEQAKKRVAEADKKAKVQSATLAEQVRDALARAPPAARKAFEELKKKTIEAKKRAEALARATDEAGKKEYEVAKQAAVDSVKALEEEGKKLVAEIKMKAEDAKEEL